MARSSLLRCCRNENVVEVPYSIDGGAIRLRVERRSKSKSLIFARRVTWASILSEKVRRVWVQDSLKKFICAEC